jgi:hypothetical protein
MLYCDALLLAAVESALEFDPDALAGHPRLAAWRAVMHAQPTVATFLASPHRHRQPDGRSVCLCVFWGLMRNPDSVLFFSAEYVAAVNRVLGRS